MPLRNPFVPRLAKAKERKKHAIREQAAHWKAKAEAVAAAQKPPSGGDSGIAKLRPFVAALLAAVVPPGLPFDGQTASSTSLLLLDWLNDRLAIQSALKKYAIAMSAKY